MYSSLVLINQELKILLFLTLQSVKTLSDLKFIDRIKMELFGATKIIRKIILRGRHVIIDDVNGDRAVGGSGAIIRANDATLTVLKQTIMSIKPQNLAPEMPHSAPNYK